MGDESESAWAKLGEHPGYVLMRAVARLILESLYALNDWGVQHDEIGEADLVML
jgi:hypothetical protein